ncbi:hypothetical protein ZIOFF_028751 [Zingiber officinale]|uniref:Polyprotein n=1 Tax=Zingiber officinale TaxID=94328 RepID=A0A8J5LE18_ZINOF|nr:hypothetical protein ZIOFF_028751 [Zingiber officinale]
MIEHLRMMSSMIRDLKYAGHDLTDEQQVQAVIRSLADSWTHMKQILTHNESIKNFSDISRHVDLEAEREEAICAIALVAQGGRQHGKKGPKKNFKRKRQNIASTSKERQTPKHQSGKRDGKRDNRKVQNFFSNKVNEVKLMELHTILAQNSVNNSLLSFNTNAHRFMNWQFDFVRVKVLLLQQMQLNFLFRTA